MVYGVAAIEEADKQDEIFDFEKSAPRLKAWSDGFEKRTVAAGQEVSKGNVRWMHKGEIGGKLTDMNLNVATKAVEVATKAHDSKWSDIKDGYVTGFSIGGKYGERWPDPENPKLMRYEAIPSEISYVDNPAMYGSVFTMVKSDGATELRKFTTPPADPKNETSQFWSCDSVDHRHLQKADALSCLEKRDFNAAQRKTAAKSGAAMKDGSFPIEDEKDLQNAMRLAGHAKNPAAAKAHIRQRAKALGLTSKLSDAYKATAPKGLEKGMSHVAMFAGIMNDLDYLSDCVRVEAEQENDGSSLPDALDEECSHLGELLVQMAEEETGEMSGSEDQAMEQAAKTEELRKAAEATSGDAKVDAASAGTEVKPAEVKNPDPVPETVAKVADASMEKVAGLEKRVGDQETEIGELTELLGKAVEKLNGYADGFEKMEKFLKSPAPAKAAVASVTVTKSADGQVETSTEDSTEIAAKELEKSGDVSGAATLRARKAIKNSLQGIA